MGEVGVVGAVYVIEVDYLCILLLLEAGEIAWVTKHDAYGSL